MAILNQPLCGRIWMLRSSDVDHLIMVQVKWNKNLN